ncbi:ribonuclease E/G [Pararhizobium sp. IMCC21322]|uniref:Rne/Rng family ribonuclease n=1 Tax=Pararhizobium sp. IMCC21322 TaxID=3067903 RepID=UPI002741475E|nr:Rne/Rng family ribonuclease [Pararhizobium sp. IMCC21322]
MANKMLIDASQPEETRVAVVKGNKVEEFDFEAANRVQLRGNIYLAKVTRVEPSLQAAFVDYGGNRHGFLAFSEIHPDYYQIPIADRQALLDEEAADEIEAKEIGDSDLDGVSEAQAEDGSDEADDNSDEPTGKTIAEAADTDDSVSQKVSANDELDTDAGEASSDGDAEDTPGVEIVGAEDALEEVPERRRPRRRQYKIQEVIKRRQVLLVQVVKEERGNKGAAMTTYLSLAGRYSVLMPNTARGGGISRKITNPADRKRLKTVANSLEVAKGMGVILRTAGANRTKPEIKRDFEYLLRLWENVRTLTLQSSAPCLVYEEGSLVKRSIRDLYSKDIDEIQVAGDAGYREAKDFMKMLMPSHAKNVKLYKAEKSLFSAFGIEPQLDAMFSPQVTLKSGGYLVINPTEALVSVDVNSGKSTREHNIEDTAVQTNLEAAEEVARQLRLRDLAGLIVIDFIDMDERRNNNAVERKLKDCLKSDRARIQVGRISPFGLMEMSRQRIRTGVLESTTVVCDHCEGTGYVRSPASISLQVLRGLEDHLAKHSNNNVAVKVRTEVALYILNQKRSNLAELEIRFGVQVTVEADNSVTMQGFTLEKGERAEARARPVDRAALVSVDSIEPVEEDDELEAEIVAEEPDQEEEPKRKRRRRRRKRGGNSDQNGQQDTSANADDAESSDDTSEASDVNEDSADDSEDGEDGDGQPRKRRRGKRGGRRNRRKRGDTEENAEAEVQSEAGEANGAEKSAEAEESGEPADDVAQETPDEEAVKADEVVEKPKRRRTRKPRAKKADTVVDAVPDAAVPANADFDTGVPAEASQDEATPAAAEVANGAAEPIDESPVEPEPVAALEMPTELVAESSAVPAVELAPEPPAPEPAAPKRSGWWRRK